MRFLADENFPGVAVRALRDAGFDVAWVRTESPGSSDEAVLARSKSEGRVLLTFDKDFGELAFRRGIQATRGGSGCVRYQGAGRSLGEADVTSNAMLSSSLPARRQASSSV